MASQIGLFDVNDRLQRLTDLGDQLLAYCEAIDFEVFRADLEAVLDYSDRAKGGRPPYDPIMMFKILVIQAQNNLSDDRTEFLINDRLSFMRFLGLSLGDPVPDAKTIWLFRERLVKAGAIDKLFKRFDQAVRDAGFIAMSGQLVDASLVAAPKQRNTDAEKSEINAGRVPEEWRKKPAKLRQKDRDAKWTVKFSKAKPHADGKTRPDITIPSFGYQNHISIDRAHGLIRCWQVTDAAAYEGRMIRLGLLDKQNTSQKVWADTAYRSNANETFLDKHGFVSQIHRKKPKGKPMPAHIRRGNATKSKVRARIEHVFAQQKNRMSLFVRTIGLARAKVKIGMANLTYNMQRLIWLKRTASA